MGGGLVQFIQRSEENRQAIRDELSAGLQAPQASVSPKYFYDTLGSRLFEAICELPEYYPTRTEAAIFDEHAADIAQAVGPGATVIDLGAGNCAKAARLFPVLRPEQYVPVDISVDFLRAAVEGLNKRFPHIDMVALGCDLSEELDLPPAVRPEHRLFFYPGSSIGNFAPHEALAFLKQLRRECGAQRSNSGSSGILFGVDLVKDKSLLDAAYDDALGVTAAFNLNLLLYVNRLLDADFDPRDWRHRGFFNAALNRVEMHLEARSDVPVQWRHGQRHFKQGETIHTECSYKYTPSGFLSLLEEAGFGRARTWIDARGWFMVCYAQAR